jgi:hypothetical protein
MSFNVRLEGPTKPIDTRRPHDPEPEPDGEPVDEG